jgi:hypothetical protein
LNDRRRSALEHKEVEMKWLGCLCFLAFLAQTAVSAEIVVENNSLRLTLGEDGMARQLLEKKSGRNWLSSRPTPFASVVKGASIFPVSALTPSGGVVRADFAGAGVEADLRFTANPSGIEVEVVGISGEVSKLIFVQLLPDIPENVGELLNICWNDKFAVCVMALSDKVHTATGSAGLLGAVVVPEVGIVGGKAQIIAVPTAQFLDTVQAVERQFGLPSPMIGGQWAKSSQAVRLSYLFTDLTEANADETIRLARLGGFGAIMIYAGTWAASAGSYPINTDNFPSGEDSLKAVIDKCHAAGLKVGMHTLTSMISKTDPLVTPRPDPRLLKDNEATLAATIDSAATVINAVAPLSTFPGQAAVYGVNQGGLDIQIDDEIIEYRTIGGPGNKQFLQCTRGFAGTAPAPHLVGARIYHLCERLGRYMVDLRTSLKDDVADNIAGVYNRCGFDMIDFDGGELNDVLQPGWYWMGQQQMAVFQRIKRDVLVQGSGVTQWLWHIFARMKCDDFACTAVKEYLDYHKIGDLWNYYHRNFMPAELGWWGFLSWAPDHRSTTPDQVELYGARMIALDTPVSVQTRLSDLQTNGRTDEMFGLLGNYEQIRLANLVPAALRASMRSGEWHLVKNNGRWAFAPASYQVFSVTAPGQVSITNQFASQPLRFRLEAAPSLATPGDSDNVMLFHPNSPLALKTSTTSVSTGELISRIEFAGSADSINPFIVGASAPKGASGPTKAFDLSGHRALAVTLNVQGPSQEPGSSPAVLNVQLESPGKMYRDYDIDLTWRGPHTVILPEPTTSRTLTDFRPGPDSYRFKAAMYAFDYSHVVAINFRWMRPPKGAAVNCSVMCVEALAEQATQIISPSISIGNVRLTIPATLNTGDYAEFMDDELVRVFDHNGVKLMETRPAGSTPTLATIRNRVAIDCSDPGQVRLMAIILGAPQPLKQ